MADFRRLMHSTTSTSAQVFAGASTALLPIALQAVAARAIEIDAQAALALGISIGAFITAVLSAAVLETRLSTSRSRPLSFVPLWSTISGLAGCLALAVGLVSPIGFIAGAPLAMLGLGIGRTHGVIARRWRAEGIAGLLMVSGAAAALVFVHMSWQLSVVVLAISTASTVIVRATRQPIASEAGPTRSEYTKVAVETTVTAAVPLILNIVVFAVLSSSEAVAFRMVLSVLGILQPLLGFMRTRLLVSRSIPLAAVLSSASLVALAIVVTAHLLGLLTFALGSSWSAVSTGALLVACLWKIVSIPSTFPFADLRRGGYLNALLGLRIVTSSTFIIAACIALSVEQSMFSVFAGLCVAETINALMYYIVADRKLYRASRKALS